MDKKAVCHGAVKRSLGPKYKVKSKAWLYFNLPLEAKVKVSVSLCLKSKHMSFLKLHFVQKIKGYKRNFWMEN